MSHRGFDFRAASVLVCVCSAGLLPLISCNAPGSGGGENGGGDANADTTPSDNSDQGPVACCMFDGSCAVMPFVECAFGEGTVVVEGVSSCAGDPCSKGACCANGGCVVTTEAECDDKYQGDASNCNSNLCSLGACCLDEALGLGNCVDEDRDSCLNSFEGTWKGFDTSCEPSKPCGGEPDLGACCTDEGKCVILVEEECLLIGSYAGDGVECARELCDTGACCGRDSTCTETGEFRCFDHFAGLGTRCANSPCPDAGGACCLADGTCVDLQNEFECESFGDGSTFEGQGTSCLGTICPVTQGRCCLQSGECVIVANAEACDALTGLSGASSTFPGAATVCSDASGVACGPPLRGACCFSFGRCGSRTVEECALLEEGVFIGMLISCSDFERLPATCITNR